MRVSILKTDNGEHSPQKWAFATASRLIEVDVNDQAGDRFIAAQDLQTVIMKALVKHHVDAQDTEQSALNANAAAQLQTAIDVQGHVDAAFADVIAAAKGTPWEAEFADPQAQDAIKDLLRKDFEHSKHLKREWHKVRTGQGA